MMLREIIVIDNKYFLLIIFSQEINQIRKTCFLQAINASVFFVSSRLIQFACFICYVLLGNTLTPNSVFVCMSLFNTIRINLTLLFPQAIQIGAELLVICKRIEVCVVRCLTILLFRKSCSYASAKLV